MVTKLIRSLSAATPELKGGVITIGNFDGVHLGHQQLIARMQQCANEASVSTTVVTFEPHPFEFFADKHLGIPRLTRFREKFSLFSYYGVQHVMNLKFNQQLATIPASEFIDHLYAALKPSHIVIGDDFHFGYKRQGNFDLLVEKGRQLGFTVEAMPTFLLDDERVSSTRIRQVLAAGDHTLAQRLLGRPYTMQGRVRGGDRLGRQLGFPTANIFLHRHLTPVHGIYTVYMHGITDHPLAGVANVGTRPTVDGTRTLLEVHLLDFNSDIYGRYVTVEFCEKLREEERYPNLDILTKQIAKDVEQARQYFKKL